MTRAVTFSLTHATFISSRPRAHTPLCTRGPRQNYPFGFGPGLEDEVSVFDKESENQEKLLVSMEVRRLYAIRYTLYAIRYTLYAIRYTLYAIRYTLLQVG